QDRVAREGPRRASLTAVLLTSWRRPIMRALIASAGATMWRSISVLMFLLGLAGLTSARAQPVDPAPPPVGGVASPAGAMIFYVAKGAPDACGPGCSEWIAAEGAIQWDTYKRLLAVLDRIGSGRKLPVVLNVSDGGSPDAASSMGRIIREHGLDT